MPCTPLYLAKEGRPFNTVTVEHAPVSLWNDTEDPTLPMAANSLAALVCSRHIVTECKQCVSGYEFAMASTQDLTIKKFTPDIEERSVYHFATDTVYYPADVPDFPNTSVGSYTMVGYATLIQSEANKHGSQTDKFFTHIGVEYDAKTQTVPGKLYAQAGVSNSPHCLDWFNARPVGLDCIRGDAGDGSDVGLRPARPAKFNYYRAGNWLAYRLFVADGTAADDYAPKGCGASFDKVVLAMKQKNQTWTNQ